MNNNNYCIEAADKMAIAIAARDLLRGLACRDSSLEYEMHLMANRVDEIAKEIGMTALTLKAARAH
jgi:hypothetical protein